jgi:hypothetical protein
MAEETFRGSADPPRSGIYLSDVLGMLRRRWIVVLVGMVLVVGAMGAAYLKAPTSYQSTGQLLLLLPPQASGSDSPTNPYLNLDPGLATAAALIASTMNAPESQRAVAAAGHSAEYSIALSPETGPLLVITTEGADPQQAIGTRDEVIRRLQDELQRIQTEENAPRRQFIHTRTNGTFNEAEVLTGDRTRAVAAVGAAGLLLTLMVVVGWDRVQASRPRRTRAERKAARKGRAAGEGETAPEGDDAADSAAVTTIEVEHDERHRAERVPAKTPVADPEDHPPDRTLVTADDHGASRR